jgi:hypothetical protein
MKRWERSLRRVEEQIQGGDMSAIHRAEYFRSQLKEHANERVRGQQIRCKAQWLDRGETSPKFSSKYESIKGEQGYISELSVDGDIINTRGGLL